MPSETHAYRRCSMRRRREVRRSEAAPVAHMAPYWAWKWAVAPSWAPAVTLRPSIRSQCPTADLTRRPGARVRGAAAAPPSCLHLLASST